MHVYVSTNGHVLVARETEDGLITVVECLRCGWVEAGPTEGFKEAIADLVETGLVDHISPMPELGVVSHAR